MKKLKICFWGNIAGALNGNTHGGGELQLALLAKSLAKGGHEVVVIDYEINKDFITNDGIKVIGIKSWNSGLRFIRVITHRLPQLFQSLKNQKADIYYCRIFDFRHIFAFWAARKLKAKFVLGIAADLETLTFKTRFKYYYRYNLNSLWAFISGIFSEITFPWLLRKADLVLVQHEGQKNILQKKHIKSIVFPNLFEQNETVEVTNSTPKDFIFVGSLKKQKGFEKFFEIVKKAPLHSFRVVGQPQDKTGYYYYAKFKEIKNVTLLGKLSHSESIAQILKSKALINTSSMEGFPNVFIEAWACGVPVLSLDVDPGGIIYSEKLGEIAQGNMNKLVQFLDNIGNNNNFAERSKLQLQRP